MLEANQEVVDPLNVVGMPGERRSEHGGHADRVLVDVWLHVLGADRVLVLLQRDDPRLDVEVAAELLPHDVHVAAEHEVGTIGPLAGRLAPRAPLPLQRQRAQHDRLGGSLRARAGRLSGGVVEVGEHADAALLDLRRLRILGVIDEVHLQGFVDHPTRLGLHPRRHERRQVAHRQAVEHHFLAHQAHRFLGGHPDLRKFVVRRGLEQEAVAVLALEFLDLLAGEGRRGRRRLVHGGLFGIGRHGDTSWAVGPAATELIAGRWAPCGRRERRLYAWTPPMSRAHPTPARTHRARAPGR